MGLDMYLIKNMSIEPSQVLDMKIPQGAYTKVEYTAVYWRKCNAVHRWFVDNVQNGNDDCGTYEVSRHKLQELVDIINEIGLTHQKPGNSCPQDRDFSLGLPTLMNGIG